MTMTIPTLPTFTAGYVVQPADMNDLAYACTFLLTKPICRVHDQAGTQSVTTSATSVSFNTADINTDGMWSSGTPTELIVQTPGFYKVSYSIDAVAASSASTIGTSVQVITGANNPLGAGVSMTPCWIGYGAALTASSLRVVCHGAGLIPWYMYAGDYAETRMIAYATGMTLNTTIPSTMYMELVST